jgi:hypothetical protein
MPETVHFTDSGQPVIAFALPLRREISSEVKNGFSIVVFYS